MVLCYRCDDEIGDDPLEKLNPPGRNGSVANRGRRTLLPLVLAIDSGRDQGEGRCATSCCKDRSVGVLTCAMKFCATLWLSLPRPASSPSSHMVLISKFSGVTQVATNIRSS